MNSELPSTNIYQQYTEHIPFPITGLDVITSGAANLALEVNQDWIFRFPRRSFTHRQLAIENHFLPDFGKACPVAIPRIEYSGDEFMGYKKLPGAPFKPEVLHGLTEQEQEQIAKKLGSFLSALHTYKFDDSNLMEYPYGGGDFWNDIWTVVAPRLSEQTRTRAKMYFEKMLKDTEITNAAKSIIHGDLGPTNILYHSESSQLSVIDFGDLCLHDPARDFNGFFRNYGKAFTQKILSFYTAKKEEGIWKRIEFYAKKHYFMLMYYVPAFGLEEHLPRLVAAIEKDFSTESDEL